MFPTHVPTCEKARPGSQYLSMPSSKSRRAPISLRVIVMLGTASSLWGEPDIISILTRRDGAFFVKRDTERISGRRRHKDASFIWGLRSHITEITSGDGGACVPGSVTARGVGGGGTGGGTSHLFSASSPGRRSVTLNCLSQF